MLSSASDTSVSDNETNNQSISINDFKINDLTKSDDSEILICNRSRIYRSLRFQSRFRDPKYT